MKKHLKIAIPGIVILLSLTALLIYLSSVNRYKEEVAAITFEDINLSEIPDGKYIGSCNVNFIYAKVEVTMKAGAIVDIFLLEHKNGKGKPAESIIADIIKKQSLAVDAVSGATNSSKVIKKAIENALTKDMDRKE